MYQIALDADYAISQPQTTCFLPSPIQGDDQGAKLIANGRQPAGFHLTAGQLARGPRACCGRGYSGKTEQHAERRREQQRAAGRRDGHLHADLAVLRAVLPPRQSPERRGADCTRHFVERTGQSPS